MDVGQFVDGQAVEDVRRVDGDGLGREADVTEAPMSQARRLFSRVGGKYERLQDRKTYFQDV